MAVKIGDRVVGHFRGEEMSGTIEAVRGTTDALNDRNWKVRLDVPYQLNGCPTCGHGTETVRYIYWATDELEPT